MRVWAWATQDAEHVVRYVLAVIAIALAIAHVLNPSLGIDPTTVLLVGVGAALLLLPPAVTLLQHVKSFKIGGVEAEFREKVADLGAKVASIPDDGPPDGGDDDRSGPAVPGGPDDPRAGPAAAGVVLDPDVAARTEDKPTSPGSTRQERVLRLMASVDNLIARNDDPRAALLLVGTALEQAVLARLEDAGEKPHSGGLRIWVGQAIELGLLPPTMDNAVSEFVKLRNEVRHEGAIDVADADIRELLYVGVDLVRRVDPDLPTLPVPEPFPVPSLWTESRMAAQLYHHTEDLLGALKRADEVTATIEEMADAVANQAWTLTRRIGWLHERQLRMGTGMPITPEDPHWRLTRPPDDVMERPYREGSFALEDAEAARQAGDTGVPLA